MQHDFNPVFQIIALFSHPVIIYQFKACSISNILMPERIFSVNNWLNVIVFLKESRKIKVTFFWRPLFSALIAPIECNAPVRNWTELSDTSTIGISTPWLTRGERFWLTDLSCLTHVHNMIAKQMCHRKCLKFTCYVLFFQFVRSFQDALPSNDQSWSLWSNWHAPENVCKWRCSSLQCPPVNNFSYKNKNFTKRGTLLTFLEVADQRERPMLRTGT